MSIIPQPLLEDGVETGDSLEAHGPVALSQTRKTSTHTHTHHSMQVSPHKHRQIKHINTYTQGHMFPPNHQGPINAILLLAWSIEENVGTNGTYVCHEGR